jgi:hypothetical protein
MAEATKKTERVVKIKAKKNTLKYSEKRKR